MNIRSKPTVNMSRNVPQGIPPLPLNAEQVNELVLLLKNPPAGEEQVLVDLLTDRVPPGVDEAAYVVPAFSPPSPKVRPHPR